MSDAFSRPSPGPGTLVIRAVFVPDGEQPPPEFAAEFNPLRIRATRDPVTGEITCDGAGTNFDGDIPALFYPEDGSAFDFPDNDEAG